MAEEADQGLKNTKATMKKMFLHKKCSVEMVLDMGKVSVQRIVED